MLTIGLTGGIACGKSMVSDYFEQLGIPVIDTDVIAKQLVEPNQPALTQIIETFGTGIIDNNKLNRKLLGEKIFNSSHKRKQLEAILHPKILRVVLENLASINQKNDNNLNEIPYCIIVIPLLFETKSSYPLDRILLVNCTEQQQIERSILRDNITREQSIAIIHSQISQSKRLEQATDIIKNITDRDSCYSQIKYYHDKYLALSKSNTY